LATNDDNDEITKETLASNANDPANDANVVINQSRLLLGFVALLYGTLNVSLRFVYDIPNVIPPTAAALSASRGWIAFLCFLPPLLLNNINMNSNKKKNENKNENENENKSIAATEIEKMVDSTNSNSSKKSNSLMLLFQSGIELSIWNFLAQGLLNIGLLSTGSARASFLTQCSILFTPIISTYIGKEKINTNIWFSCFIALVGLIILTIGGTTAGAAGAGIGSAFSFSLSQGDLFVLGGALSWSIYLFRISIIGPKHNEIQLQGLKTGLVAILYSIWWYISSTISTATGSAVTGTATGTAGNAVSIFTSSSLPSWMTSSYIVWIALFFSAIGPGTIADVLQQKAQNNVTPSEANVILSSEPVFATLFAVFLFGEKSSLVEIIGGGLILCSALIATTGGGTTTGGGSSSSGDSTTSSTTSSTSNDADNNQLTSEIK